MQIQSRNPDGSFLSKKTARASKNPLKNDSKAVRGKILSFLQHGENIVISTTWQPSDSQITVQILWAKEDKQGAPLVIRGVLVRIPIINLNYNLTNTSYMTHLQCITSPHHLRKIIITDLKGLFQLMQHHLVGDRNV